MGEDPSQKTKGYYALNRWHRQFHRGKNLFAYVIKELGHHADTYCIDEF